MGEEHGIVRMVRQAKKDSKAADELIAAYMNFIRSETAKFNHSTPSGGRDDELSIAMFAFYEAIQGYEKGRGSFLSYAAAAIRNRLIDYYRKEERHKGIISYDTPLGEEDGPALSDKLADEGDAMDDWTIREATKEELEEFGRNLLEYGLTLSDVADNCPKQDRTLSACHKVLKAAKGQPQLLDRLMKSKRLPMAELAAASGGPRKTLERHRIYLVAILLAYTNGYEMIRGHLCQISGGKEEQT